MTHAVYFIALALATALTLKRGSLRGRMPVAGTIAVAVMGFVGYNGRWSYSGFPEVLPLGIAVLAGVLIWLGLRLDLPAAVLRERRGESSVPASDSHRKTAAAGPSDLPVASPGFGDMSLREVMTPKAMIAGVDLESPAAGAVRVAGSSGHSRLVVYDGDLDHIVGVVNIHDLLESFGGATGIGRIMRPAMFLPESKKCFGTLERFLREREQFAVVLDEFGGTAGIVTVEDLLDELVGEMADEHEREEAPVRLMPDGSYLVPGHMKVDEINSKLGVGVPEGGYETISGYVLERLGRVPARGEKLSLESATLEIAVATARRIVTVKVVTKSGGSGAAAGGRTADEQIRMRPRSEAV